MRNFDDKANHVNDSKITPLPVKFKGDSGNVLDVENIEAQKAEN